MTKRLINEIKLWVDEYKKCYSYAETGRKFGVSECLVRHYLIKVYKKQLNIQTYDEYQKELEIQRLRHCLGEGGCGEIKKLDEFEYRRDSKTYRGQCKACVFKKKKVYRGENKDHIKSRNKKYRSTHKEEIRKYNRQYETERIKNDVIFRMKRNIRIRIRHALKGDISNKLIIQNIGCNDKELKKYIKNKFYNHPETNKKMTWKTYGKGWHIDHIMPLMAFDLTNVENIKKANHYTNLQPLWVVDHNKKTAEDNKEYRKLTNHRRKK